MFRTGTYKLGTYTEYYPRRISLELSGVSLDTKTAVHTWCNNELCVNPDHIVHDTESRFWAKVKKLDGIDSCWVWIARQDDDMYGRFCYNGKTIKATHYSWKLYTGRLVPKSLIICHKCDHPYCVNPNHLFIGTRKDNSEDMVSKGRSSMGEKQGLSKLTEGQVRLIRELRLSGITTKQLSNQFSCSKNTIGDICRGKTWTHIL